MSGTRPAAVIGIGNEFRGDDAAGLLVLRALRARGAAAGWELMELSGEGAGLIDAWENRPKVLLVDAVNAPATATGTVLRYDDPEALPAEAELRCSSHAFGVGAALALARVLGRLPAALTVYGIVGANFTQGAPLSRAVEAAIATVAATISEREWNTHA